MQIQPKVDAHVDDFFTRILLFLEILFLIKQWLHQIDPVATIAKAMPRATNVAIAKAVAIVATDARDAAALSMGKHLTKQMTQTNTKPLNLRL